MENFIYLFIKALQHKMSLPVYCYESSDSQFSPAVDNATNLWVVAMVGKGNCITGYRATLNSPMFACYINVPISTGSEFCVYFFHT